MFEEKRALFIYCVSPVHMGTGSAIGVIDNPIQRERHTEYPMMAGSGIKGAIRHDFWAQANGNAEKRNLIKSVFGPDPSGSSDYAGAISFSDAQLLAFPVRSVKRAFLYVTSPTALARMLRTLDYAEVAHGLDTKEINGNECWVVDQSLLSENRLALETYDFAAQQSEALKKIAKWVSENAMPSDPSFEFFRAKMANDLVLIPDEDFSFFVRNATVVEPHVRINDVTGTAVKGGLFYTENLPPESLLLSMAMATKERKNGQAMTSSEVMGTVLDGKKNGDDVIFSGINGRMVQVGGDATTGRGQVFFTSPSKAN